MLLMVNAINRTYFAGKREVTCFTCHRPAEHRRSRQVSLRSMVLRFPENSEELAQFPEAFR